MRYPMNAYEQGQMAEFDGQPRANPYSMFSSPASHDRWYAGFDAGGWSKVVGLARVHVDTALGLC